MAISLDSCDNNKKYTGTTSGIRLRFVKRRNLRGGGGDAFEWILNVHPSITVYDGEYL